MRFLIILQALGIVAAAVAAHVEIRSILVSGPVLSAGAVVLAAAAYGKQRLLGLYFALGAPTVAVLCFALIFGRQWSPAEARGPLGRLIVEAAAVLLVLGVLAFREAGGSVAGPRIRPPFQFSLRALLAATLVCAVLIRLAVEGRPGGVAAAVAGGYVAVLATLLRRFHSGGPAPRMRAGALATAPTGTVPLLPVHGETRP